MTQPSLHELRELERSDNFRFDGKYWCVIRYLVITNSESYHGNLYLTTLTRRRVGSWSLKYWHPTKQRLHIMEHASKAYYKKMRRELMRNELAEINRD